LVLLTGGLIVSVAGEKMRRTRIHERQQGRALAGANAVLHESEEKYRSIVETAREGIVMSDADARMIFVNDRWSEILHDDLQQILVAAKFHLSMMRNRVKQDGSLQALGSQIDERLKEAIEKSRSLAVHVRACGKVDLPSDTRTNLLYRAAQELLFNVVKHARVKEAAIAVRQHGRYVCLSVSDHGRGFDPQQLREVAGYGLLSIRERVELLGGRVKIRSTPGKGSTVLVIVPNTESVAGSRT
jgi:signal transduction histidine kinase